MTESSSDNLFKEYSAVFDEFDDLTLARWLAQTLGQLRGRNLPVPAAKFAEQLARVLEGMRR